MWSLLLQTAANYREEVRIFKKFHANVIGKGGATLRKLREETDTKIELPGEKNDSDVIVITGKKENVQKARARIQAIEKEMVQLLPFLHSYVRQWFSPGPFSVVTPHPHPTTWLHC